MDLTPKTDIDLIRKRSITETHWLHFPTVEEIKPVNVCNRFCAQVVLSCAAVLKLEDLPPPPGPKHGAACCGWLRGAAR